MQTVFEDFADVFGVETNAEVSFDKYGDTLGSPQVVGPAVASGSLEQQFFELAKLFVAEFGSRARMGFGGESIGMLLRGLSPAVK